jgi:hypothetical protein
MSMGYNQFIGQLAEAISAFPSLFEAESAGKKILKGFLPGNTSSSIYSVNGNMLMVLAEFMSTMLMS